MIAEAQQADVTPEAGVVLLAVEKQRVARGRRVETAGEVGDVGHPLFLVDDQALDHMNVFGLRLANQPSRIVAVGAAVVHVDVKIAAPDAAGGKVVEPLQRQVEREGGAGGDARGPPGQAVLQAAGDLDSHRPRGDGQRRIASGVEVADLEATLAAIEGLVG